MKSTGRSHARRGLSALALFLCISTGIFIIAVASLLLTMRQSRVAARQRGHDVLRALSTSLPVPPAPSENNGEDVYFQQLQPARWAQDVLQAEMRQLQALVTRIEHEREVTVVPLYDALDAVREFCGGDDHPNLSYVVQGERLSAREVADIKAQRRSACESALSRLYRDMNPSAKDVRGNVMRLSEDQMLDLVHSARLEAERRDEMLLQGALPFINIVQTREEIET